MCVETKNIEQNKFVKNKVGNIIRPIKSQLKIVIRKKVLVVPYTWVYSHLQSINPQLHLLLLKDTPSNDWTLMSGGCKMNEDPFLCAKRELSEETNGVLDLPTNVQYFSFKTWYRPQEILQDDIKRGLRVLSHYHVFLYEFPCGHFPLIQQKYLNAPVKNKETIDIKLFPFHELNKNNILIWDFIRFVCVPHLHKFFMKTMFHI